MTVFLLISILIFNPHNPFAASKPESFAEPAAGRYSRVKNRATFLAVGDLMLSRGVGRAIKRARNPLLPFSQLTDLLGSTDFNFGNLESPVSGNNRKSGRGLVFNTDTRDLAGLREYNFQIVSLANNHALDQGLNGLRFTRNFLEKEAIQFVGVGENKAQAWQSKVIVAGGIRIGFIGASYSSINDGGVVKNDFVARIEELDHLKSAIEQLKTESDFIVVIMHAGVEFTRKPNRSQITFARTAIDDGADLVIGAHPHWIQPFELYQGKFIFYSLGNFVFDQRKPDTKEGLSLKISLIRERSENVFGRVRLEKIELVPLVSEQLGIPRPATPAEAKAILRKIGTDEQVLVPAAER